VNNGQKLYDIAREYKFSSFKLAKIYCKHIYGDSFQLLNIHNDENITNMSLKEDLIQCCMDDPMSSRTADIIRHCSGHEYEEVLINMLISKKMCFETEAELRKKGKPKTPGNIKS
jgi:hypothetical protein